jgi:predicted peptidase
MRKKEMLLIGLFFILGTFTSVKSQDLEKIYAQKINYLLYFPENYKKDTTVKWPLIVFLHGGGERGTNLNKVKATGPLRYIATGKKLPFVILSPQIRPEQYWDPEVVIGLLNEIIKTYRIDTERIYLTGLSIGGLGTWETSIKYPEKFAAIAPVSGWGDPKQLWKISHTPVWIFHGAKDQVVPVIASTVMADTLKKYGNVKLTVYPKGQHGNWAETYNNEELYKWFLEHKINHQN